MMKRVLLYPNINRDQNLALTQEVVAMLTDCGVEAVVCPLYTANSSWAIPQTLSVSTLDDELDRADMIITFGGDGTILRAARAAAGLPIPILGVNMGSKGFMAELEQGDIDLIRRVVAGDYTINRRMMLDVEIVRGGNAVYRDFALNDVVVTGLTKVVNLTLFGDGQVITSFSGDGVIVATPTGSTAYSMAAGGPIVEPSTANIIITPVCAHVLAAKSFVLASDRRISVELGAVKANPAIMTVDGGAYRNLLTGDVVNVCKSGKETLLVHLANRSFYKKVSEKLGERF
ncbi:NAD(+)/NADH kinase [Oscillospiraceae bacterium WX1]